MLQVKNIDVAYGALPVLWDVSLDVGANSVVALIGPNGAGKTTTLKSVSGLLRPKRGEIHFLGQAITQTPPHQIVDRGLSLVPEWHGVFASLSVVENLELGAFPKSARPQRASTLAHVYDLFPRLAERKSQRAGTLSGGERRMLAIGRALMAQPKLLMLDEPSLGLAPLVVEDIFAIIRQIRQAGVSILIVEQNVQLALEIAEWAYIIENGRVVQQDSGERLLQDERVKEAYLGI
jgi:branched-chain amino acid transport system ATP-binding protein